MQQYRRVSAYEGTRIAAAGSSQACASVAAVAPSGREFYNGLSLQTHPANERCAKHAAVLAFKSTSLSKTACKAQQSGGACSLRLAVASATCS